MYVVAALVLIVLVVLSRAAQNDTSGSRVEAYEPRAGAVSVEAAPTSAPANSAVMAVNDLVRECPSPGCLALSSPVMLMAGTPLVAIARDGTATWVLVGDTSRAWQGWVPVASLTLASPAASLPLAG